jgi:hypothetical protein
MKNSCTFCRHLGPLILNLMNTKKKTKWEKKKKCPFKMDSIVFKKLYRILFSQMHYMNITKHKYMHFLSIKKFEINCIF